MSDFSSLRLCAQPPSDLRQLPPWAELYPHADQVLGGKSAVREEALRHLFPVLRLDLSAFDPDWSGHLTVMGCYEPYDGTLGAGGDVFFNDWVTENWLAFRLDAECRMHFLGDDWRYFEINRMVQSGEPIYRMRDLRSEFGHQAVRDLPHQLLAGENFNEWQYTLIRREVQRQWFEKRKSQAQRRGGLYPNEQTDAKIEKSEDPVAYRAWLAEPKQFAWDIGGSCSWDLDVFHAGSHSRVHQLNRKDQYPITPGGHAACYLGCFPTGHYGIRNDAETQVFFEPMSRTVWQHFCWS